MATTTSPPQPVVKGRGPLVILLGVLMLAVLVGVLYASGMGRQPGHPSIGQPAYQLPDHSTTDTNPAPVAATPPATIQ
jgi:hypothetical protein